MQAKSLDKYPVIKPGTYKGTWSAYYVRINFENGKQSEQIAMNVGVRGINLPCDVEVDNNGQIFVIS